MDDNTTVQAIKLVVIYGEVYHTMHLLCCLCDVLCIDVLHRFFLTLLKFSDRCKFDYVSLSRCSRWTANTVCFSKHFHPIYNPYAIRRLTITLVHTMNGRQKKKKLYFVGHLDFN